MSLELQRTLNLTRPTQLLGFCVRDNGDKPLPSEKGLPTAKELNRMLDHYEAMTADLAVLDQTLVDTNTKPDQVHVQKLPTRFGQVDAINLYDNSPFKGIKEASLSMVNVNQQAAFVVVNRGVDLEAFVKDPNSEATYNLRGSLGGRVFVSTPGNLNLIPKDFIKAK